MKWVLACLTTSLLALSACRTTRPAAEPLPPLAAETEQAAPPPQVVLTPVGDDLRSAPGGAVVTMTEARRREFFASRAPVFEPMPEPYRGGPAVRPGAGSASGRLTDFPLFWTLTYGGLGAIIGNQFGGRNGEGAAIGAGLGLMRDTVKWGD